MNKSIIIAAVKFSKSDGIFKKISAQAGAFSKLSHQSELFCLGEKGVLKMVFINGFLKEAEEFEASNRVFDANGSLNYIFQTLLLLKVVKKGVSLNEVDLIYIRHMIPTVRLIGLLSEIKRKKIKVIYELPTYPYFFEQFQVSKNKLKAIVKLLIDFIFWPLIYLRIDVLSTVFCRTDAKKFSKMFNMYNGVNSLSTFKKIDGKYNLRLSQFEVIGVGTVYPYHGYDRILTGISKCNGVLKNGKKIIFHIVGESEEIEKLKKISMTLGIEHNVIFHGAQFGDALDRIFNNCLLGVGTLSLSIRNANIDTALKNIEYFARDLPVISGGRIFDVNVDENLYKILEENEDINFDLLYDFSEYFYTNEKHIETEKHILDFEWDEIISKLMKFLNRDIA